jgi:ankyrin repeat protein
LKRQAKELLQNYRAGAAEAVAAVNALYRDANASAFALHDAQLVIARAYGFDSWPKLKAYVDGVTVRQLVEAVVFGNVARVRAMLRARPELVHFDTAANDERRAIHHAVLTRSPEIVQILMQHGADARKGVYPHRSATSALAIARERGYDEIVAIIALEERRRRSSDSADEFAELMLRVETEQALERLHADPSLARGVNRGGWSALHVAAGLRSEVLVRALLECGADPNVRGPGDRTPLDHAVGRDFGERFGIIAAMLVAHGAELTARAAVALGDADWVRARTGLTNQIEDWGGLLSVAVKYDRPEMLRLLLELGMDPNERVRVEDLEETEFSSGMPLWHCAVNGKLMMAELLLQHGANPNAHVYASGSPIFQAYGREDEAMIALLRRYGGVADAATLGHYRRTTEGLATLSQANAEEMLWAAACGGDPELVRAALRFVDWPAGDVRWFRMLEQPLRMWNHLPRHWGKPSWDRTTYLGCFRLLLERAGASVTGRFGLTILHDLAAVSEHMAEEERVAFGVELLEAGALMDIRDELLKSTPLGWACRWGRTGLVQLLLERGADPVESDAEPWATPRAWAEKMGRREVLDALG